MDENAAYGIARAYWRADLAYFAYQFFAAGGNFPGARAQDQAHQDDDDYGERNYYGEGGPETYAHARHGRFNQEERAENHGDDSSDAEDAMRGKFRFQNEQHEGAGN